MTEIIGKLWQEGENLAKNKQCHEALLSFQRAKSLLIKESSEMFKNASKEDTKASKILGEIMEKLQISIGKTTDILTNNPNVALQLPIRGYSKIDVKKAYRKHALKYHPVNSAPNTGNSSTSNSNAAHNNSTSKKSTPVVPQSSASANRDRDTKTSQRPNRHVNSSSHGSGSGSSTSGGGCELNNELLREILKKFGFQDRLVSVMPRDELIRKYLAVKAHMAAQQEKDATIASNHRKDVRSRAGSRHQTNASGSNSGSGRKKKNMFGIVSDSDDSSDAGKDSRDDEDADFFKEMRGRGKGKSNTKTPAPSGPFSSQGNRRRRQTDDPTGTSTEKQQTPWVPFKANLGGKAKDDKSKAQVFADRERGQQTEADIRRKQRVACLKEDIPQMGISDLRMLMKANGVSWKGCIERSELVDRLYQHFGIDPPVENKKAFSTAPSKPEPEPESDDDKEQQRRRQKEAMYNLYNPTTNNRPVVPNSNSNPSSNGAKSKQNTKSGQVHVQFTSDATKANIEFTHVPKNTSSSTKTPNTGTSANTSSSSNKDVPNKRRRNTSLPAHPGYVDDNVFLNANQAPPDLCFPKPPTIPGPAPTTHQQRMQQMYENSPYASNSSNSVHGKENNTGNSTKKKRTSSSYSSGTATTAGVSHPSKLGSIGTTTGARSKEAGNHPVISTERLRELESKMVGKKMPKNIFSPEAEVEPKVKVQVSTSMNRDKDPVSRKNRDGVSVSTPRDVTPGSHSGRRSGSGNGEANKKDGLQDTIRLSKSETKPPNPYPKTQLSEDGDVCNPTGTGTYAGQGDLNPNPFILNNLINQYTSDTENSDTDSGHGSGEINKSRINTSTGAKPKMASLPATPIENKSRTNLRPRCSSASTTHPSQHKYENSVMGQSQHEDPVTQASDFPLDADTAVVEQEGMPRPMPTDAVAEDDADDEIWDHYERYLPSLNSMHPGFDKSNAKEGEKSVVEADSHPYGNGQVNASGYGYDYGLDYTDGLFSSQFHSQSYSKTGGKKDGLEKIKKPVVKSKSPMQPQPLESSLPPPSPSPDRYKYEVVSDEETSGIETETSSFHSHYRGSGKLKRSLRSEDDGSGADLDIRKETSTMNSGSSSRPTSYSEANVPSNLYSEEYLEYMSSTKHSGGGSASGANSKNGGSNGSNNNKRDLHEFEVYSNQGSSNQGNFASTPVASSIYSNEYQQFIQSPKDQLGLGKAHVQENSRSRSNLSYTTINSRRPINEGDSVGGLHIGVLLMSDDDEDDVEPVNIREEGNTSANINANANPIPTPNPNLYEHISLGVGTGVGVGDLEEDSDSDAVDDVVDQLFRNVSEMHLNTTSHPAPPSQAQSSVHSPVVASAWSGVH